MSLRATHKRRLPKVAAFALVLDVCWARIATSMGQKALLRVVWATKINALSQSQVGILKATTFTWKSSRCIALHHTRIAANRKLYYNLQRGLRSVLGGRTEHRSTSQKPCFVVVLGIEPGDINATRFTWENPAMHQSMTRTSTADRRARRSHRSWTLLGSQYRSQKLANESSCQVLQHQAG